MISNCLLESLQIHVRGVWKNLLGRFRHDSSSSIKCNAAIIFSPTPNRPRCCCSTYLPEVRNEHTATETLSERIPIPLSSHEIDHKSFTGSISLSDTAILGRIRSASHESREFSMSSRVAIYRIRSPVNPAKAELSTKNSDSAFLLKLILALFFV